MRVALPAYGALISGSIAAASLLADNHVAAGLFGVATAVWLVDLGLDVTR